MKIAFYEIEDWKREYLAASALRIHELLFFAGPLPPDAASEEVEVLSIFIRSRVTAAAPAGAAALAPASAAGHRAGDALRRSGEGST